MRTKKALKNMLTTLLSHFTSMLIGFIVQAIFIRCLGTEYLGINGLFNNIFSMLAVVELGIGSAIIYNLYKPVALDDQEKIKSLINFYKKCYRVIAVIIFTLSILIIPFLNIIVGKTSLSNSMIIYIYLLFMIDIVCSYLLTYKRSILYASQNNYIIDIIHIIYLIVLNFFQVLVLLTTKNYILYLIVKIIMRLVENIAITIYVNKKYVYLNETSQDLDQKTKSNIIKKVKGLFLHKLGVFFVGGTDNIIISAFLGVSVVGLYSNYNIVITALSTIINQIFSSFKSSIGNLLITKEEDYNYLVYKRMQFLNFWFAMMSSIGILIVMESFITVWIGEKYLLDNSVLITLAICNYVYITKLCTSNFKEAAGIFYEDRFIPILESIVNIVLSVIFVKLFGLMGVFLGTICCYLITHLYTYPCIVYKKVFNKNYINYFKDNIKYLLFTITIGAFLYFLTSIIDVKGNLLNLLFNIFIVFVIPNIFIIICFNKTNEFNYYKEMIFKFIKGK